MFYISDISGTQSPYNLELFRQQRREQLEEADHEINIEGDDLNAELSTLDAARLGYADGLNSSTDSSSGSKEPSSGSAIGTAGASMLHREGSSQSKSSSTKQKNIVRRNRELRYSRQSTRLRPAGQLKLEEEPDKDQTVAVKKNPYQKLDELQPKRKRAIYASDIMSSSLTTIHKDMTLDQADLIFKEHRFRHLPVVSDQNRLIGIISDRDSMIVQDKNSTVENHMTVNVLTARPKTDIRQIAEILFEESIGAMPIVNESGDLLGMITRSDILCAVINQAPLELWV